MPFRVLFVCTGNVCRSPGAQLIFSARAAGHDIACASAGTGGLTGRKVDEPTALALREIGIDPEPHRARRLTPKLIRAADLILTAEVEHRAAVIRDLPDAFRRTFTLREFGRLGADLPSFAERPTADALCERVVVVAERRGWVDAPEPGADDIGDPFGAGPDVARACVEQLSSAVDGAIAALGLRTRTERTPSVLSA